MAKRVQSVIIHGWNSKTTPGTPSPLVCQGLLIVIRKSLSLDLWITRCQRPCFSFNRVKFPRLMVLVQYCDWCWMRSVCPLFSWFCDDTNTQRHTSSASLYLVYPSLYPSSVPYRIAAHENPSDNPKNIKLPLYTSTCLSHTSFLPKKHYSPSPLVFNLPRISYI